MPKKPSRARSEDEIPVWFVQVLEAGGYVGYHLRLSREVAKWLEGRFRILVKNKQIGGFLIQPVEETIIPAFHVYDRYDFNG